MQRILFKSSKKTKKKMFLLFSFWTFGNLLFLYNFFNGFHYSEVVNLAGKIRGEIQRAAKLYLAKDFNNLKTVKEEIDKTFKSLDETVEKLKLPIVDWRKNVKPTEVYDCWNSLRVNLQYPPSPKGDKSVLEISENCWLKADNLTNLYQKLAQRNTFILVFFYTLLFGISTFIVIRLALLARSEVKHKLEKNWALDSLTKVLGKESFREIFHNITNAPFVERASVIKIDLDNFKKINDIFGVSVGDEILVRVAQLLKNNLRKSDVIGRWGGDKFLILLPNTDLNGAQKVAEKLRKTLENRIFKNGIKVTASFGITEVVKGEELEETLLRLNKALYKAKEEGKNRIKIIPPFEGEGSNSPLQDNRV
ncbi:MAG TPA: GGDEF domain-containing protein [Aquifex aeolicus]|nr:GGDEF domain-containing protein [Aquifex aeolicus]